MDSVIAIFIVAIVNLQECHGDDLEDKLLQILRRNLYDQEEPNEYLYQRSTGYSENSIENDDNGRNLLNSDEYYPSRRFYEFHPGQGSTIIGAPTSPNQLPEAEAILPGHTLLRPALGMLKSAVKFPHKDLDDGAGVYGNIKNLGITYGGTGERVLYTGFRRSNDYIRNPRPRYLLIILRNQKRDKPVLRYYKDYHKLEIEKQRDREEDKRMERNDIVYADNVVKVKEHLGSDYGLKYQTFVPSGLLIQFLESPSLKEKARLEEQGRYPKAQDSHHNPVSNNDPYNNIEAVRPTLDNYPSYNNPQNEYGKHKKIHGVKDYNKKKQSQIKYRNYEYYK